MKNEINFIHSSLFKIKKVPFLQYIIFGLGLFSALRFSTGGLFAYTCLLTYFIAIIFIIKNDLDKALAILVLSLFYVSDYGEPYYDETISYIKYMIIITILTLFLLETKYKVTTKSFIMITLLLIILTISTLLQFEYKLFNLDTFKRDIQIFFLLILSICTKVKYANESQILFIGILGYFFGEVLNYFYFHHDINEYMNYSSLKALVFLPVIIYFGLKGKLITKGLMFILTILIMSEYGTRLIIISWIIWFLVWGFTNFFVFPSKRSIVKIILTLSFFIGFSITVGAILPAETSSKSLNIILLIISFSNGGILILQALDPVRYAEHILFFTRPHIQLIFGSGLGSGIFDSSDLLYFIVPETGAFSKAELKNNIFFNFHDIWVDFALRFGVIPLIYLFYCLTVKRIRSGQVVTSFILTMVAFCSTFSTAGLVVLFILAKKFNFDLTQPVASQKKPK